jgi:hypothetical protein
MGGFFHLPNNEMGKKSFLHSQNLISALVFTFSKYLSTDISNLPTSLSTVNHRYYTANLTTIKFERAPGEYRDYLCLLAVKPLFINAFLTLSVVDGRVVL